MSTANIREARTALAFRRQTDIATLPTAANFWSLSKSNPTLATVEPKTEDDAQDLGKGDEFANNVYPVNQDANVQFEKYATSEVGAYLSVFGLGAFTKTSPDTGAYQYTCTPLDPVADGIELPFTSYLEAIRQGGSAIVDRALVGCIISEWGLQLNSGPGRQNAKFTFTLAGSGRVTSPSGVVIPTAYVEHGLNAGSAAITILGNNYVTLKRVVSLEFGWNNNPRLDQGLYPGSGTSAQGFQLRGRIENGDRVLTCNFKVRLESTSDELPNLLAQTEGTATFSLTGDLIAGATSHLFQVTLHRVRIASAIVDDDQGIVTVSVQLRALKHATNGLITVVAVCAQDNIGSAAA